jgi:hypothetical protein
LRLIGTLAEGASSEEIPAEQRHSHWVPAG